MNYKPVKAVLLRNNDRIIDTDGVFIVTDIKFDFREDIITYTATDVTGKRSARWTAMNRIVNKVTS